MQIFSLRATIDNVLEAVLLSRTQDRMSRNEADGLEVYVEKA